MPSKAPKKRSATSKTTTRPAQPARKVAAKKPSKSKPAKTSSISSSLIPIGQSAPDFALPDQSSTIHRLADARGHWLILYFYPKDDTPGCTTQACQFRDHFPHFQQINALIWGISPDSPKSHTKFAQKYTLPFPLLADENSTISTRYGVWQEKSMYGRKYMGIVRTTYLINPQGKIAHRWDQVSVTNHHTDVMEKLQAFSA